MISRKRISYAARDIGEGYDMQQHIIRILRYQGGVKHIISTDLTQVPSGRRLDGEVWLVTRTFPAQAWYTKYVQYNNYGPLEVEGPQLLVLSICQLVLLSGNIVPEDMYSVSSSMSQYLGYLDNSSSMMHNRCQIWGISRMWLIWGRGRSSC